jgi:hypothetical protein
MRFLIESDLCRDITQKNLFLFKFIALDFLMLVLLGAVSIAAIVRNSQVDTGELSGTNYRQGSLAAAAVTTKNKASIGKSIFSI